MNEREAAIVARIATWTCGCCVTQRDIIDELCKAFPEHAGTFRDENNTTGDCDWEGL